MAKRVIADLKQYDYSSKEEMEKHIKEMKVKGWYLVDGELGIRYSTAQIESDSMDKWKYTAIFIKDKLR